MDQKCLRHGSNTIPHLLLFKRKHHEFMTLFFLKKNTVIIDYGILVILTRENILSVNSFRSYGCFCYDVQGFMNTPKLRHILKNTLFPELHVSLTMAIYK